VNGRPIYFSLIGIHHLDLKPRRFGSRFGAKYFREFAARRPEQHARTCAPEIRK
jgi:hypothetical protein